MTQRELAQKLDVSEVTVSRWLNGERSPSRSNLENIAKALGVPPSYLFGNEEEKKGGLGTGLVVTFGVIFGLVITAVAAGILSKDEKDKIINVLKEDKDEKYGR